MKLTIDSPVQVSISPASGNRGASCNLSILGGVLWFPSGSFPETLRDGIFKSAVVEVGVWTARTERGGRTLFTPYRLVSVS